MYGKKIYEHVAPITFIVRANDRKVWLQLPTKMAQMTRKHRLIILKGHDGAENRRKRSCTERVRLSNILLKMSLFLSQYFTRSFALVFGLSLDLKFKSRNETFVAVLGWGLENLIGILSFTYN